MISFHENPLVDPGPKGQAEKEPQGHFIVYPGAFTPGRSFDMRKKIVKNQHANINNRKDPQRDGWWSFANRF